MCFPKISAHRAIFYTNSAGQTISVSTLRLGIPSIYRIPLINHTYTLRFYLNVQNAAHDIVSGLLAVFQDYYFNRVGGIVGTQDQVTVRSFDITDDARPIFTYGVYISFAPAVGGNGIVVAVEQQGGARHSAGVHAGSPLRVRLDNHKAFPAPAVAFHPLFQALQEALLKLQYLLDVHAHNQRLGGCDIRVGDHYVFEFVVARRKDRGALVDFGWIDEIQHRKMLYVQNSVHAFQAESALAVQEVGDVGLLEAGLFRQTQAREFPCVNVFPQDLAEIFLKHAEFHRGSITRRNSQGLLSR